MRRLLDAIYGSAAALAALCMVGLLVMVLLSIAGRQLHFNLPGTDAYAGYLMAGAGFLALAHTLKRGEHIRVTLILSRLPAGGRRWLERWATGAAMLLALLFAWFSVRLVFQSLEYHDISTGNDATPLWIPQLVMAVGTVVLAIATVDEFVLEWRGRAEARPVEAARHE